MLELVFEYENKNLQEIANRLSVGPPIFVGLLLCFTKPKIVIYSETCEVDLCIKVWCQAQVAWRATVGAATTLTWRGIYGPYCGVIGHATIEVCTASFIDIREDIYIYVLGASESISIQDRQQTYCKCADAPDALTCSPMASVAFLFPGRTGSIRLQNIGEDAENEKLRLCSHSNAEVFLSDPTERHQKRLEQNSEEG